MMSSSATGETDVVWVRHTWDLTNLRLACVRPSGYDFRGATAAERSFALQLILDAYASDPIWAARMAGITGRMTERVEDTFGRPDAAYMIAACSGIPVGVSGVATHHWTDQHLLTGICVVPQHQRRGVGRYLLAESLSWLRAQGVAQAQVYTAEGSLADRKMYQLFGSTRVVGVDYPGVRPRACSEGARG